MNINKLNPDVARADIAREANAAAEQARSKPEEAQQIARADQVEISDAGRALAEAEQPQGALKPELIQSMRQKVVGGLYDRPEVIAEVAHRMQASGDLRAASAE